MAPAFGKDQDISRRDDSGLPLATYVAPIAMPGLLGGTSDVESRGAECQPGYPTTPLHSGSRFVGHQQSKGNKYQVEVVFKVN